MFFSGVKIHWVLSHQNFIVGLVAIFIVKIVKQHYIHLEGH